MTFDMRYSKIPSSPEFDAIKWKEGRAIIGAPSGADPDKYPGAKTELPILVAYFDFDNDGQIDTVVKNGFNRGYSYMSNGKGDGLLEEYLMVFRGQKLEFTNLPSLWAIQNEAPIPQQPVSSNSTTYIRPFIYNVHTYVARYDMDLEKSSDAEDKRPQESIKETMSILDFHFSDAVNKFTHKSEWDLTTVCEYKMNQIKN